MVFATASFAASNVIQYTYDHAGNITNVTRQSTGGLAITSFSPSSGSVGTAVTIYGTGFSATPANNTVTFNGTAATVTASDSGSIATTVPSGATTGRIAVTVGGVTVQSATDFVITVAGAPTIASFTPAIGASGTSVTITGTNFNATSGATTFTLNGVAATGGASSTTAASLTIPSNASSGRISATTSIGTGTSTSDFIVPPTGLTAADIATSIRIAAGSGNAGIAVGTTGKSALVLFDGALNGWYSLHFKAFDVSPTNTAVSYKVIKPDNSVLMNGTLSMTQATSLHLPKLTAAGTYSLLLSPGSATLSTQVRLQANPAITLDGSAIATALDYPLQTSRFTFDATAGQRIGVGAKGITYVPLATGQVAYIRVFKPDGTQFASTYPPCTGPGSANTAGNCALDIVAPVAGTYTIVIDSGGYSSYYTNTSLQLSSPATGTLAPDVAQAVSLTRVGQHTAYTFTVAAGDSVGIDMSNVSLAPQSGSYQMTIYKPDGSYLNGCSATQPGGAYCEFATNLPAGTYTVVAEPAYGAYGTFNLTLKSGTMLTTTASPTSFTAAGVSETVRAKFTATAGQNLAVGVGGLTYVGGGGGSTYLSIYGPTGSSVGSTTCNPATQGGNCMVQANNLAAGTYGVVLKPASGTKLSGTLAVSSDLTGALTAGTAQAITVSRVGQRAAYTFSGTAGDNVAISIYGVTTSPSGGYLNLGVNKPDGSSLATTYTTGNRYLNFASLPSTGTYTVILNADYGLPFSTQLLLDQGTSVTVDASATTLSESTAGQPLRYRFSGTAGQRADFGITGLTYAVTSGSATGFTLFGPTGSTISSGSCNPQSANVGSCDYSFASLPSTGTYVLMLLPPPASQISGGSLALSTPQAGTFVVGDPAQAISITRPGQTARYTFNGTASQTLRFNWTSTSVAGTGWVDVTVLDPNGGSMNYSYFYNGSNSGMNINALPSTGTYTIVLDPAYGTTMSGSFSLVTR